MDANNVIVNFGGRDYELNMKYRNMKFLKAKFGISFSNIGDDFEEHIEKIIYSALKPKDGMPPIKFEAIEGYLDDYGTLEQIFEIINQLFKVAFPKESKKIEEQEENKKKLNGPTS